MNDAREAANKIDELNDVVEIQSEEARAAGQEPDISVEAAQKEVDDAMLELGLAQAEGDLTAIEEAEARLSNAQVARDGAMEKSKLNPELNNKLKRATDGDTSVVFTREDATRIAEELARLEEKRQLHEDRFGRLSGPPESKQALFDAAQEALGAKRQGDIKAIKTVKGELVKQTEKGGAWYGLRRIKVKVADSGGAWALATSPSEPNVIFVDPAMLAKESSKSEFSLEGVVSHELSHLAKFAALINAGHDPVVELEAIWNEMTDEQKTAVREAYGKEVSGAEGAAEFASFIIEKQQKGEMLPEQYTSLGQRLVALMRSISDFLRGVDAGPRLKALVDGAGDLMVEMRQQADAEAEADSGVTSGPRVTPDNEDLDLLVSHTRKVKGKDVTLYEYAQRQAEAAASADKVSDDDKDFYINFALVYAADDLRASIRKGENPAEAAAKLSIRGDRLKQRLAKHKGAEKRGGKKVKDEFSGRERHVPQSVSPLDAAPSAGGVTAGFKGDLAQAQSDEGSVDLVEKLGDKSVTSPDTASTENESAAAVREMKDRYLDSLEGKGDKEAGAVVDEYIVLVGGGDVDPSMSAIARAAGVSPYKAKQHVDAFKKEMQRMFAEMIEDTGTSPREAAAQFFGAPIAPDGDSSTRKAVNELEKWMMAVDKGGSADRNVKFHKLAPRFIEDAKTPPEVIEGITPAMISYTPETSDEFLGKLDAKVKGLSISELNAQVHGTDSSTLDSHEKIAAGRLLLKNMSDRIEQRKREGASKDEIDRLVSDELEAFSRQEEAELSAGRAISFLRNFYTAGVRLRKLAERTIRNVQTSKEKDIRPHTDQMVDALNIENEKVIDDVIEGESAAIDNAVAKSGGAEAGSGAPQGVAIDQKKKAKEIIRGHYTEAETSDQPLAKKLTKGAGINPKEAEKVEAAVTKSVGKRTRAAKKKAVDKIISKASAASNINTPDLKIAADELIKDFNKGSRSKRAAWGKLIKKFKLPEITEEMSRRLKEYADAIDAEPDGNLKNKKAAEMMKYLAKHKGVDAGDIALAFYYSSILSGVGTQTVNTVSSLSNLMLRISHAIAKHPAYTAVILGAAVRGMTKAGWLEFRAALQGDFSGRRSYDPYAIAEKGVNLGGVLAQAPATLEMISDSDSKWLRTVSHMKYVQRLMVGVDLMMFKSGKEMKAAVLAIKKAKEGGKSHKEVLAEVEDELFLTEDARVKAYDKAKQDLKLADTPNNRLSLAEKREIKRRQIEILEQSRDAELDEQSTEFGLETTYTQKPKGLLGALANWIDQGVAKSEAKGDKAPKWIKAALIPFTKIVANVVNEKMMYVPGVGMSRTMPWSKRWDLNEEQRSLVHYQQLVGSMLLISLMAKALDEDDDEFEVTALGPTDKNKRRQLEAGGYKRYTIKLFGKRINYSEHPLGQIFAMMGVVSDEQRYGKGFTEKSEMVTAMVMEQMRAPLNQGFLSTIGKVWRDISFGNEAGLQKFGVRFATGFVPRGFKDLSKAIDPAIGETDSVFGTAVSGMPIARAYGKPALNALGEPMIHPGMERFSLGRSFWVHDKEDEFFDLLKRKGAFLPGLSRSVPIGDRVMTDDERYEFVKRAGAELGRYFRRENVIRIMERLDKERLQKFLNSKTSEIRTKIKSRMRREAAAGF